MDTLSTDPVLGKPYPATSSSLVSVGTRENNCCVERRDHHEPVT